MKLDAIRQPNGVVILRYPHDVFAIEPGDVEDAIRALSEFSAARADEFLIREGFEIAVEGAELCHEAECVHDRIESHINWTSARSDLEEHLSARAKEPK